MNSAKFSRRIFIKTLLAAVITAGCRPISSAPGENSTATPRPDPTAMPPVSPTPTALPQPDAVAQAYFAAWEGLDFPAMYHLLTAESQQRVTESEFQSLHYHVFNQVTTLDVDITPETISTQTDRAAATFTVLWQTALFGEMMTEHVMNLRYVEDGWRVVWDPALLMPQLGYGIMLVFQEEGVTRGNILAADDSPLAENGQILSVGVVPGLLADASATAAQLSRILGKDVDAITAQINAARPDWYVPLGVLDLDTASQYGDLLTATSGIDARVRTARAYPQGDTAAHVVGRLGVIPAEQAESYRKQGYRGDEMIGQIGLEAWGEPFLAGKRGGKLVTVNAAGAVKDTIATAAAVPGGNIHLHLDIPLQKYAEQLLGARTGAIIATKVTGEVLVMATYPRYNPQSFATGVDAETWAGLLNDPLSPLLNRAAQGAYPPASVFKIVSMAAAMEKLDMSPEKTFVCNGIWYGLGENFPK